MSNFNTIQATVLQRNSAAAYFCDPCGNYGKTMPIPCSGTSAFTGVDMWATPIKKTYPQGFRYQIGDQPTLESMACFKLTNTVTGDYYIVLGTVAAYSAACAACCDTSPAPTLVQSNLPAIPTCQSTCTTDGTNYDAFFAVQSPLTGSGKYVARVELDGGLVNQQTYATGSSSIAALVTYLNTNASQAGTWSNPQDETIRLRTTSVKEVCFIACVKTS